MPIILWLLGVRLGTDCCAVLGARILEAHRLQPCRFSKLFGTLMER